MTHTEAAAEHFFQDLVVGDNPTRPGPSTSLVPMPSVDLTTGEDHAGQAALEPWQRDETYDGMAALTLTDVQIKALTRPVDDEEVEIKPDAFGAVYLCIDPGTQVLKSDLSWQAIGDLRVGDDVVALDENSPGQRRHRKMRQATVTAVMRRKSHRLKIHFTDGREIICSPDHRWLGSLSQNERQWWPTRKLKAGATISWLGDPWRHELNWEAGYLAGLFDGEGSLAIQKTLRRNDGEARGSFRMLITQNPGVVLDTAIDLLSKRGFKMSRPYASKHSRCLRVEVHTLYDVLRLLGSVRPVRLLAGAAGIWQGKAFKPNGHGDSALTIETIELLKEGDLCDIETTAGTFVAGGLVSHNCHAGYRRRLNEAFQPGGWSQRQISPWRWDPDTKILTAEFALYARGSDGRVCYVSKAIGGQQYFGGKGRSQTTYDDAAQGAESNSLMRNCKQLGMALELWERRVANAMRARIGVKVFVKKDGETTTAWRRKDDQALWGESGICPDQPTTATQSTTQPAAVPADNGQREWGQSGVISLPQAKRLYALVKQSGMDEHAVGEYLKRFGYVSSKQILRKDYDTICKWVQAGGDEPR